MTEQAPQLVESDVEPEDARRVAEQAFGDRQVYRQKCVAEQRRGARMTWWRESMSGLFLDVRYALRGLRKAPGFALGVVLTLGIGIGANTVIFTVIDGTILKPVNFPNPEQL